MFGGYAQFVARPESYWIKVSPALDLDQGAAAMWPCATAHRIIADRLDVRMNDNILITGASGGMGTATMQLAKLAGATVIATTRHPGKAAKLKREGADVVVDTSRDDALRVIRDVTRGEGVDAAVEYTGATALMRLCLDALRLGGTFCPVGGELKEIPLRVVDMVGKELNVRGIRGATRNDQRIVAELLGEGRIAMPIHAVLPLAKVAEAHAMLESSPDLWAASCCIRGTLSDGVLTPARAPRTRGSRARLHRRDRHGLLEADNVARGIPAAPATAALGV